MIQNLTTPLIRRIFFLGSMLTLSGCISLPGINFGGSDTPEDKAVAVDNTIQQQAEKKQSLNQQKLSNALSVVEKNTHTEVVNNDLWQRMRSGFKLGIIEHPRIDKHTKQLQGHPRAFNTIIGRSEPYLHFILDEIEKRGMPAELALLPAVESAYRPYAASSSGASGLWQFMPVTGKYLGLKSDWWHDERRDVRRSTQVALDYLASLNKRFDGNWLHALAAYNAGGGRINRAIRKAKKANKPYDFWHLDLPAETDNYVPRLLAFSRIVLNPEQYAISLPVLTNEPYFVALDTPGQLDLKVAADSAGITLDTLMEINPSYHRWATHPDGPHRLLLPIEHAEKFNASIAKLPAEKRLRWTSHTVKAGDVVGKIARRYGISADIIRTSNNLKNNNIRIGQQLLIPSSETWAALPKHIASAAKSRVRYRIRKGDSLYKIARRFQVKVADLKRWNKVGKYIKPGQRLTVYVDSYRKI